MEGNVRTLGFGLTFDTVAAHTACGRPLNLAFSRSSEENPPHQHVNDYLCIFLSGGFTEQERNTWRERSAGCYFTHRAGETHHDRFGRRGALCLSLHYAPGEPAPGREGACQPGARVAADQLAFELAADSREELALASLAAEIMDNLQSSESGARDDGGWIDRIVTAISDEPRRRWRLQELAEIADRHPTHVAQAFRSRTGTSLGAFQRLRRLTRLSLVLRHGQIPLAVIAADFGYFDQAHMTSEFSRAFGTSPGKYRRSFS